MPPPEVTRFAPSPTGRLHLGHAYSAHVGWRRARDGGGRFLVRIDDLDLSRSRPEHEAGIFEDLAWLGLDWAPGIRRQSACGADYQAALGRLVASGLTYPCICTRSEIRREVQGLAAAPHGPDGPLYPGTCRGRALDPDGLGDHVVRLDTARAARAVGPLTYRAEGEGDLPVAPELMGDIVLARRDGAVAYHLAVVVDDHAQGITTVTRGLDLEPATHVQRLLQALLGLEAPRYLHHRLITDRTGQRLAKRNDALSIQALRQAGATPDEVWGLIPVPPAARPRTRSLDEVDARA